MKRADNSQLTVSVDEIIEKLMQAANGKTAKNANLKEEEVLFLCIKSQEIFAEQPILLELEAPLKICGNRRS